MWVPDVVIMFILYDFSTSVLFLCVMESQSEFILLVGSLGVVLRSVLEKIVVPPVSEYFYRFLPGSLSSLVHC
jgi:hypothetical protein